MGPVKNTNEHVLERIPDAEGKLVRIGATAVAIVSSACLVMLGCVGTLDSSITVGPKHMAVHQATRLVGPSVQINERGVVSAVWVEDDKESRTIYFARAEQTGQPLGKSVPVNQPDENVYFQQESPAVAVRGEEVFVTWSQIHPTIAPDKPFASELRLSRSTDGGRTFSPSILVNDDGQLIQHMFDSIEIAPNGTLHMAWIDGREGKKEPGTFVARSTDHGRTISPNFKLDGDTCVCCRTSVATSTDGVIYVAWRKVFENNIRETVVSRSTDGGESFSPSVVVGNDQWVYPACPHRPASLGVDRQGRLYVVWYSEDVDETPAIYLAYSDDQGQSFSRKKQLNRSKGTVSDHPQMAVDLDGRIVVIWEEQSPNRREVVISVSLDRGQSFGTPVKMNEMSGTTPSVAVNQHGAVVVGWKEHAMPDYRLVIQTLQLPTEKAMAKGTEGHEP